SVETTLHQTVGRCLHRHGFDTLTAQTSQKSVNLDGIRRGMVRHLECARGPETQGPHYGRSRFNRKRMDEKVTARRLAVSAGNPDDIQECGRSAKKTIGDESQFLTQRIDRNAGYAGNTAREKMSVSRRIVNDGRT